MSGWDQTRRVKLDPPWDDFYIDLWEDPPIGAWIDLRESAVEALGNPTPQAIAAALMAVRPLVSAHNLTNRAGEPIELELRVMGASLFTAVLRAILRAVEGAGTTVPLGKPARSSGTSSQGSRRRRVSSSGSSPSI